MIKDEELVPTRLAYSGGLLTSPATWQVLPFDLAASLVHAITGGKKLVIVLGNKKAFAIDVRNDKTQKKFA